MSICDFHSHILPGIDDGSRDLHISMQMLEQIRAQKIDIMVATPHFYASRDRIDEFLNRREAARDAFFDEIRREGRSDTPRIRMGSEVAFFDGMSRAERLPELAIEGTNLLLLEMPFAPWTQRNIEEVSYLIRERDLRILIAHLERFMWMQGNRPYMQALLELPVYVQLNAEALLQWRHRRTYLRMLEDGTAHVLGSDCHSAHHRAPNLQEARKIIEKKRGRELLEKIDQRGYDLLFGHGE